MHRIECGEGALTSTLVLCEVAWVLEAMGKQSEIKPAFEKSEVYSNDKKHLGKIDWLKLIFK